MKPEIIAAVPVIKLIPSPLSLSLSLSLSLFVVRYNTPF